jgi:hypothetical protein
MKLRIYDPRILAIDLRHRRFGYAVYEGHKRLLDWGVCVYPAVGDVEIEMMKKRLGELRRLFSPSSIVIKQERWDKAHTDAHMRLLVAVIALEASNVSIPICLVDDENVRTTFRNLGCETKDEVAAVLARIFPELVWSLPPKRRAWDSEHSSMTIFDAIALGLTYWQHPSAEALPAPE